VGVCVGVDVGIGVGVNVGVIVALAVGVDVCVFVDVDVALGVYDGGIWVSVGGTIVSVGCDVGDTDDTWEAGEQAEITTIMSITLLILIKDFLCINRSLHKIKNILSIIKDHPLDSDCQACLGKRRSKIRL